MPLNGTQWRCVVVHRQCNPARVGHSCSAPASLLDAVPSRGRGSVEVVACGQDARYCQDPASWAQLKSRHSAWVAGLTRAGYAAITVRHCYGLLSQIMGAALDDGDVQVNPCTAARKSLPRLPEPEPQIITPEQVPTITAHLDAPWDLIVEVLAYTGVRIGEALALRRRSVDLMRGRLVIRENATEVNGVQAVGETKTHQQRTRGLRVADRRAGRPHGGERGPGPGRLAVPQPDRDPDPLPGVPAALGPGRGRCGAPGPAAPRVASQSRELGGG